MRSQYTVVRRMPVGAYAAWTEASRRLQMVSDAIEDKLRLRQTLGHE